MLQKKQNQGPNNEQILDNTSITNANTHSLGTSSVGNTTTENSMLTSALSLDDSMSSSGSSSSLQPTELMSTIMPTASSNTMSSSVGMPTHHLASLNTSSGSSLSPISTHSQHEFDNTSMDMSMNSDDNNNIDYHSPLFLKHSHSSFTFGDSPVPLAKSLHMFTDQDLKFVKSMRSFLYLVFRNPKVYEVTFFKVCYVARYTQQL